MIKSKRKANKLAIIRGSRIFKVVNPTTYHGFEEGTLVRWVPRDEHGGLEEKQGKEALNCVEVTKGPFPLRQWVPSNELM